MGNVAIDNGRMEALNAARVQPPKADGFSHLQNGKASNYPSTSTDDYLKRLHDNSGLAAPATRQQSSSPSPRPSVSDIQPRKESFHVPNPNSHPSMNSSENDGESNSINSEDLNHGERLDRARQQSNASNDANQTKQALDLAKDAAELATPFGAVSLMKQIDFFADFPFFAAIGASILKDLLDLIFIASLPGLGTVMSLCLGIFIFMMTILGGAGGKRKFASSLMKKGGVVILGTIVSFIPGINFIPEATATSALVYVMTLSERKHSPKSEDEDEVDDEEDEGENEDGNDGEEKNEDDEDDYRKAA